MKIYKLMYRKFTLLLTLFLIVGCGGGSTNSGSGDNGSSSDTPEDTPSTILDRGIQIYYQEINPSKYRLEQLSDDDFNQLSTDNKLKIADKLLSSLFYAYSYKELVPLVNSGTFLSTIKEKLKSNVNDMDIIEARINDKEYYYGHDAYREDIILSRFYAMKSLDKNYFDHWISYILTQSILFSPATELTGTVARPDLEGVYNRLYTLQHYGMGMRYSTFLHMQSTENWRRFRSPEDNGREMLEIYALDTNDNHVPMAAQALQNWHLSDPYGDTLMVSLNQNTTLLDLKNGIAPFRTGLDFFAEIVKSPNFTYGITTRLVDFMFMDTKKEEKEKIINKIVSSHPETWADILQQIIFSKTYLLNTPRVKSIEELVFPLMKKLSYNSYYYTFHTLRSNMEKMNQASMKYKLGKINRVPIDDISFAHYQKYIRDEIVRKWSRDMVNSYNPKNLDDTHNIEYFLSHRKNYYLSGISTKDFIAPSNYEVVENNITQTSRNYVNHIFNSTLYRNANDDEIKMIIEQFKKNSYEKYLLYEHTNPDYQEYIRLYGGYYFNYVVFEYLLRLSEFYFYQEVK